MNKELILKNKVAEQLAIIQELERQRDRAVMLKKQAENQCVRMQKDRDRYKTAAEKLAVLVGQENAEFKDVMQSARLGAIADCAIELCGQCRESARTGNAVAHYCIARPLLDMFEKEMGGTGEKAQVREEEDQEV